MQIEGNVIILLRGWKQRHVLRLCALWYVRLPECKSERTSLVQLPRSDPPATGVLDVRCASPSTQHIPSYSNLLLML